ncbi:GNAT family N-acetyltransferase [Arenicella xantha]|uniref:Acetyltransferase (GNAT) family protein n=1 Tax=Arenicella xantha TaxID=644221 RepID=A0A395JRK3_9GAMM|nr:GNAT family N-acetyltransferase [Arenicella xantha]RBP51330.1 acetyltransferase (GNAT) family protein [Arenicella xantha]
MELNEIDVDASDIKILKQYSNSDHYERYISQVADFADQNKNSFGFNPVAAYRQMSLKGQLWLATGKEHEICGYIMFGGVYPNLRVFQLFVNPLSRGRRIGTKLLDELIKHGNLNKYSFIHAKVAAELPANQFWEKSGFSITQTSQGGSAKSKNRRRINHRLLQLDTPDLLTPITQTTKKSFEYLNRPTLSPPIYALDLNVLFDLVKDRENAAVARDFITKSMNGAIKIVVTQEFITELERTKTNSQDPLLALARALPTLPKFDEIDIAALADELREIIFPQRSKTGRKAKNDLSDLRHLAYSILASVDGFVTGEHSMLARSAELYSKYGVEVISPSEFVFRPDDITQVPTQIDGEPIEIESCRDVLNLSEIPLIAKLRTPDNLIALIESHLKTNKEFEANCLKIAGITIAYCGINFSNTLNGVDIFLFVDESHPQATLAVDHFIERSLRQLPQGKVCRTNLYISLSQIITRETAITKGFIKAPKSNNLIKLAYNGVLDSTNWKSFVDQYYDESGYRISETIPSSDDIVHTGITLKKDSEIYAHSLSLFDFESLISPGVLNHDSRSCVLIPIRESFAIDLLGNTGPQASLFCTKANLLMLEKAYFRSPTRARYIEKGTLIAFYVSGKSSPQEVIGTARVTYSEIKHINDIGPSLSRQGVIDHGELVKVSNKNGNIHVFTFDNFKKLPRPIGFKIAKELGLISAANLATIEKLMNDKLSLLFEAGY